MTAAMLLPSQQAGAVASRPTFIAVANVALDPNATYTPAQLQHLQQQAAPAAVHASAETSGVVTPFAVASGFMLWNPGRRVDTYNYDSDWNQVWEYSRSNTCTPVGKYQAKIHEWVQGGTSKLWRITITVQHESGNIA
jgi:hypothetical protein